jgi:hypothetical protein
LRLQHRPQNLRVRTLAISDLKADGLNGFIAASALALALTLQPLAAEAKLEGVNRPDLLPKGDQVVKVIDVAGFLTTSEEKKLEAEVEALERDTGFKLRVLAQSYPETPGLAIRDYWGVDERSIIFVADPTFKNILNFNVGQGLDLEVPRSFWSRLSGKYGNKFYWTENGENAAIIDAVSAIDTCLREEPGRNKCSNVQGSWAESQ